MDQSSDPGGIFGRLKALNRVDSKHIIESDLHKAAKRKFLDSSSNWKVEDAFRLSNREFWQHFSELDEGRLLGTIIKDSA